MKSDMSRAEDRIEYLEDEVRRVAIERDEARLALEAMRASAAAHLDEPTRTSESALYALVESSHPWLALVDRMDRLLRDLEADVDKIRQGLRAGSV